MTNAELRRSRTRLLAVLLTLVLTNLGLSSLDALAQSGSVRGRVVDERGTVVAGANVALPGSGLGAISHVDGTFEIVGIPVGDHVLTCSFIGYRSARVQITVPQDRPATCIIVQSSLTTDDVVVTAARRPQLASDVPASLSIVTSEYLATRRIESLDHAIRNVSGVQLQGNQVNIRGSSGFAYNVGSRVLLLIDGMSLLSPDTDGIPFESFPISQIRQVEILKGPGSALYGSGALGGVVNLISRPVADEPATQIRTSVGFYEPYKYAEWTSKWEPSARGRLNFGVSAMHARRFGENIGAWVAITGTADEGFLNENRSRVVNSFGKINARLSARSTLDVLLGVLVRRRDNFLFWNGLEDPLNPGNLSLSRDSDRNGSSDNQTTTLSLLPQLVTTVGTRGVLTTRGRLYALLIRPIDEAGKVKPLSDGTAGFRFGAETQYSTVTPIAHLTTGLSVDANITRSSFFLSETGAETGRQPEGAIYLQAERSHKSVDVVAGLRADIFWVSESQRETGISPKLGLSYRLSERTSLRGSFGKGFRIPSVAERYTDDQGYFPIFRNLDLLPESSVSYELGARTSNDASTIRVDASVFWYQLDNLIEPRFVQMETESGSRLLGFQFVNLEQGRVRGSEIDAVFVPTHSASFRFGYTILTSENRTTGRPLAYRPRHLLVAGANVTQSRWSAGIDFRFASEPEVVDSDFARFIPDASLLVDTIVTDIQLSYSLRRVVLGALVNNIFDYYYLDRPALLAAPREFVIQATATF